ncbi:hypothetical protein HPB52_008108 [Rhipicephalus sanguineus]|uniref:Uncharacterized protein n=1 Tax=Rhipicephalus sanguineus TaxID=34632 RepID=A0A9D4T7H0_RHISA|nr:hypothetical protein HPB52_008108 [Rhipicephalus sanguineus]
MQKQSGLSDVQKGMIIGFRAKGGSISETAEFVNYSRAAVVKVYRAWQNGTVQNHRRGKCGAPRAIDDRGQRRLRRCVRANRHAAVKQLTAQMNQGATNRLRLGLHSRRLVHAPMLTAVHRRRRLESARQYRNWTSTEWRQIDRRWRIRRETSERKHPATIAGRVQAGALRDSGDSPAARQPGPFRLSHSSSLREREPGDPRVRVSVSTAAERTSNTHRNGFTTRLAWFAFGVRASPARLCPRHRICDKHANVRSRYTPPRRKTWDDYTRRWSHPFAHRRLQPATCKAHRNHYKTQKSTPYTSKCGKKRTRRRLPRRQVPLTASDAMPLISDASRRVNVQT